MISAGLKPTGRSRSETAKKRRVSLGLGALRLTAVATFEPGATIGGKFTVRAVLGVGGMGAVYEVEHVFTKHRRALKLLHPHVQAQPVIVERFLREASAAGRIGNAHIVETFDAGVLDDGVPYLAMELLNGRPLCDRFAEQRKMPLAELADIVRQACIGVQAAHDAGIVHRDLKPENLFLENRDGHAFVKILDFGISKFDAELTGGQAVTREGSAMGTPYYMPPEQVRGVRDLDRRADVYALGVILYEGAAGRRPFEADSLPHLSLLIHEGKAKPLHEIRPELPRAFSELVAKAMHADRDLRLPSALELERALAPFVSPCQSPALDATLAAGETPALPAPPSEVSKETRTESTDSIALGRTVEQPPGSRKRVWVVLASVTIVLGVVALIATRAREENRQPTAAAESAAPSNLSSATAPQPTVVPIVASTAMVESAEPLVDAAPVVTRAPGASARTAPSAKPPASATRADQRGLAGNPFDE